MSAPPSAESRYRPGACNIGGSERRRRYRYAAVAFAAAAAYLAAVLVVGAPTFLLAGLFVPFSLGTEWALQARRSFCASLALSGRYSFDGDGGEVDDADAHRSDRNAGLVFAGLGILAGAVATGIVYGAVALL
ncbi:hypothetical protein [Halosegnis marinus]|uniref:DUF4395 domain-containing protein n=1 Tax=Halosegnis marinus TaxID=3034023 RepID=A0ABD5ZLC9_9EURY|nr:hypothetical protein [Halosegnis sp. DT85]